MRKQRIIPAVMLLIIATLLAGCKPAAMAHMHRAWAPNSWAPIDERTIILTAFGDKEATFGETQPFLLALDNKVDRTPASAFCEGVYEGDLSGQPVVVVTTGTGGDNAGPCMQELLYRYDARVKEVIWSGIGGATPAVGGLVAMSFVCLMNWIAGWEMDALTLTAILTVIGFSVNDTVVVFDRIRENLHRYRGENFDTVANRSLLETATRSIGTQVTAMLVLVALLVLGGATLQQFTATLLVGFISGMYSSIFNATPLLAAWDEHKIFHSNKSSTSTAGGRTAAA